MKLLYEILLDTGATYESYADDALNLKEGDYCIIKKDHCLDYGKIRRFIGSLAPALEKEIPDLVNLQAKYNKDGLEIVGITLNSGSAADIKKFADQKQMNYTVLTDFDNNETHGVTRSYSQAIGQSISSMPTTLLIDREGYIVKGYLGARSEEVFYNDIKEYL